jgi:hypothetical protein
MSQFNGKLTSAAPHVDIADSAYQQSLLADVVPAREDVAALRTADDLRGSFGSPRIYQHQDHAYP